MSADEDSDSNSLPDLYDLFPAPSDEIAKGDIVWAKYKKKLCWPALVRHVYPKERKVRLWYTDAPGKCFKVPLQNVFPFHDPDVSAKVKREAIESGVTEKVESLTSHALSYLNRKAEGYKDDPMKFFDLTYPFFTLEEWLKKNPNANIDDFGDLRIGPICHSRKDSGDKKRTNETATEALTSDEHSELISVDSEDVSDKDSLSDNDYMKINEKIPDLPNTNENEYVNKIIMYIKSGKADKHLEDVLLKNIISEYHKFFESVIKTNKTDLNCVSYGPIEDVKKLRELSFYLIDLYDNISLRCKSKKRRVKSFIPPTCHNNFEKAHFVSSVWLPESIIFAISEIEDVSLSEAKKLFHKKSVVKQDRIENIFSSADNDLWLETHNEKLSECNFAKKSSQQHAGKDEQLNRNTDECAMDQKINQMCKYEEDEYTRCLIESCNKRICVVYVSDIMKELGEESVHDYASSVKIKIPGVCLKDSKKKSVIPKKQRRKLKK